MFGGDGIPPAPMTIRRIPRKDGASTIPLVDHKSFHQASRGGHRNISPCSPPPHPSHTSQDKPSGHSTDRVNPQSNQNQLDHYFDFDWDPSFGLLGSGVGLFQSIGVGSSVGIQTAAGAATSSSSGGDDWLYGLDGGGCNTTTTTVQGPDLGLVGVGLEDWTVPSLASSAHDTPILGTAMPAGDLDGLFSTCNSTFSFNYQQQPLPTTETQFNLDIPTTVTSTDSTTPNLISDAFTLSPMSPPQASSSASSSHGGQQQQLDSQGSSSNNNKRRSPTADDVDPLTALKRQRNNVAARKYRQKRIDRINELEAELQEVKDERDDLRLRLARQEAEAAALRSMLQMNNSRASSNADAGGK
ncbi:hypothetical protein F4810DRAFT_723563 [Camillea tinctor]|nr:hypothetical protein F4810DRAFT_723563 [Camillea tinctor]